METLSIGLCWRNTGYPDFFAVTFVVCNDDVIETNNYFANVFGNQSLSLYFVFTKSQRASMRLYEMKRKDVIAGNSNLILLTFNNCNLTQRLVHQIKLFNKEGKLSKSN